MEKTDVIKANGMIKRLRTIEKEINDLAGYAGKIAKAGEWFVTMNMVFCDREQRDTKKVIIDWHGNMQYVNVSNQPDLMEYAPQSHAPQDDRERMEEMQRLARERMFVTGMKDKEALALLGHLVTIKENEKSQLITQLKEMGVTGF